MADEDKVESQAHAPRRFLVCYPADREPERPNQKRAEALLKALQGRASIAIALFPDGCNGRQWRIFEDRDGEWSQIGVPVHADSTP